MALATGVSALLTLALMRSDLLAQWRANVGNDAPNRFLINVQDQQLDSVRALLHEEGLADAQLWPMVRGRFVARNDRAVDYAAFESPRARRLAEREFNLSFSDTLPANNTLTAGRFFERQSQQIELSAEVDFARALGWQLGDRIRFDLGGLTLEGSLTSLRRVRWESFQPNFFVLVSPNARKAHSASWIGSFRLNGESKLPERLFAAFPNVSLLDLDAIVSQIRSTVDQVSRAIELMFYFTLFAGLLVLWAANDATQDERNFDAAVMRVMGASGAQLKSAHRVEFIALGLCTGLLAALSASVMTALIARVIFDFTLSPNLALASSAIGATTALVLLFGLIGTRRVRSTPPSESLRQLNL
jgi:putative ABC transport system permease protein